MFGNFGIAIGDDLSSNKRRTPTEGSKSSMGHCWALRMELPMAKEKEEEGEQGEEHHLQGTAI
jgi:hypothetical protein